MDALSALLGIWMLPVAATALPPPMPPVVVLIVCKTEIVGKPDKNAAFTHVENREWAYVNAMMQCKREVITLTDPDYDSGLAAAQPFNTQRCNRAGIMQGVMWDQQHKSSNYRFWRHACPVPTVDTNTGTVLSWSLPDCGHRETVVCEKDSFI